MTTASSGLYYHGTNDKVRLSDRVEVRGWFGVKYRGYVSYIPGLSPKNRSIEYADVRQWAITSDDGTTYVMVYDPENSQPRKKIRLLGRQEGHELDPNIVLQ